MQVGKNFLIFVDKYHIMCIKEIAHFMNYGKEEFLS